VEPVAPCRDLLEVVNAGDEGIEGVPRHELQGLDLTVDADELLVDPVLEPVEPAGEVAP
jgi:hypothetical protein